MLRTLLILALALGCQAKGADNHEEPPTDPLSTHPSAPTPDAATTAATPEPTASTPPITGTDNATLKEGGEVPSSATAVPMEGAAPKNGAPVEVVYPFTFSRGDGATNNSFFTI